MEVEAMEMDLEAVVKEAVNTGLAFRSSVS